MTVSIRRLTAILFVSALAALAQDRAELALKAAMDREMVDGDLKGAIDQYKKIVAGQRANRAVAAKALLRLAECQERLGAAEARKSYEQLVKEFGDQKEQAAAARARLVAMSGTIRAGVTSRQLWTENWFGAPSADGRTIAILDQKTGDILAHDLVTGENKVIVKYTKDDPASGWWFEGMWALLSADGRRIVFTHYPQGSQTAEIRMSAVDNPRPRVVWKGQDTGPSLSDISLDGQTIAVRVDLRNWRFQIGLINVADGTMRVLKTLEGGVLGSPKLSPDNRFVAYTHVKSESALNYDIHAISVADGSETALVSHDAQDLNPVWTPDGRGIVFASNRRGAMDLWRLEVRDGQPAGPAVMVKSDLPGGGLPTYLFGFNSGGSLFYSQRLALADVLLSGADPQTGRPQGEAQRTVDGSAGTNLWPTLSPDGRLLATFRNAGYEVFTQSMVTLRDLSSGSERTIPTVLPAVASARWAADGKTLAIRSVLGGQQVLLYELDVRTGDVRLMLTESRLPMRMAYNPWCLSPDSGTLYFAGYEKQPREAYHLLALDVRSGQTREVVRETNTISQLGCSHDGEQLAYSVALDPSYRSSALKVVASKGGQPRVILASTSEANAAVNILTPIQWAPDGKAVYYQAVIRQPGVTQDLVRVPAEGGPPERMGLKLEPFSVASFSRDGRFVAYRGPQQHRKELWAIDNFLPKK